MPLNILMTSIGRRVALVDHFREELSAMDPQGKLFGADRALDAPARYFVDEFVPVPDVLTEGYINTLLQVCEANEISLIVPLIDTELQSLAENSAEFEARGIRVVVSSPEAVAIANDKLLTHTFFVDNGFDTPRLHDPLDLLQGSRDVLNEPVIIKPASGSASKDVFLVRTRSELEFFTTYIDNPIVQEWVDGEEFTLDALTDFDGKVRCVVPRKRIAVRAGEVSKGVTVKNQRLIDETSALVEALPGPIGCITVQCFLTPDDQIKFIEINPRFGGGYPLSYQAGANFPRWLLEMHLGCTPDIGMARWQEGLAMLRYDDAVFENASSIYP